MQVAIDRAYSIITLLIRISLAVAAFGAFTGDRWSVFFVTCTVFLLTFIPLLLRRNVNIRLPVEFELVIVLFVYASLFLGDIHDYYTRFWWWDVVLHSGSALAFGATGFIIMWLLLEGKKITASPILAALFAFCFAMAIGAMWEIVEFGIDQIFGANMQKSGLVDTMWDLIIDAIGALVASAAGWLYLKGRKPMILERAITKFVEQNPHPFK